MERADFFLAKPGPEIVTDIEKRQIVESISFETVGVTIFGEFGQIPPKKRLAVLGIVKG